MATNGNRAAGPRSRGREPRAQRRRAHLRGGPHRRDRQFALAALDARSSLMSLIALAPSRLTDLLSSPALVRAKRTQGAMNKPRTDEDQALVARTQAGDAAAFDELVIKYSPRLYGLVYNMTENHEDTNDLLQDVFAKAFRAIKGFRGKSSFYTWIHTIAVNMTLNFLKKRGRRYHLSLDDVDASIQNDKE